MKKAILSLFAIFIVASSVSAQTETPVESNWKYNFQTGLNLNQAQFSENWKGGGVNSYAYGWFLNYLTKYAKENTSINSDLQLQLGYAENKGQGTRKNADRIFYDFKYGHKIKPKWDLFASLNLLSQFAGGYNYGKRADGGDSLVSALFAPAYLTSSVGLEYKPLDYLWMRFGVGTLRQTFVLDQRISDAQLYGLKNAGDKLRNQLVLQYIANFDKNLAKNVNLKARYTVNWDYSRLGEPNQFVHIFNANLTLKATKYISTNVQLNLIKDYDQDKEVQLSQILSLGILYSLTNK